MAVFYILEHFDNLIGSKKQLFPACWIEPWDNGSPGASKALLADEASASSTLAGSAQHAENGELR